MNHDASETQNRVGDHSYHAKLTHNYRLTVPHEVRQALGLKAGDTVVFRDVESGVLIERQLDLEDIIGSVPALPNVSPDFEREIEEAIEDALLRKYERLGMLGLRPKTDVPT